VTYFLVEEVSNVGKSCMYSSVGYMQNVVGMEHAIVAGFVGFSSSVGYLQNVVVMEHEYCSWFCWF